MALHRAANIDSAGFKEIVTCGRETALVCFLADWSQPCKDMRETIDWLTDALYGTVKVLVLDTDEAPLEAAKYLVTSVPTLVLFVEGEPVCRVVGVRSFEDIEQIVMKNL